jgi:hypothetical protein
MGSMRSSLLWLPISYGCQVHQILLQLGLVRGALIDHAVVLVVKNGKNELLILVQVLLNELRCDVRTCRISRHVLHHLCLQSSNCWNGALITYAQKHKSCELSLFVSCVCCYSSDQYAFTQTTHTKLGLYALGTVRGRARTKQLQLLMMLRSRQKTPR